MRWLRSLWNVSVVEWLGCLFWMVRELWPTFDLLNVPNLVVHFFRDWMYQGVTNIRSSRRMCQQIWNIQSKLIRWINDPFSPNLSLTIPFIIRPRRSAVHYGQVAQVYVLTSHMCWCWILLSKIVNYGTRHRSSPLLCELELTSSLTRESKVSNPVDEIDGQIKIFLAMSFDIGHYC